jgi:hypothetical protein
MGAWPRFVLRLSVLFGAAFGTGAGAVVAALRAAEGESLAPALVIGIIAGALAAPVAAAVIVEQMWPGLAELRFRDRRAVIRSVRDGKPFDRRLAPAVLGFAVHTRRVLERTGTRRDRRWLRLLSLAAVVVGFTILATLGDGSPAQLLLAGASVLWVAFAAVYLPRRYRQIARNADRAASAAAPPAPTQVRSDG